MMIACRDNDTNANLKQNVLKIKTKYNKKFLSLITTISPRYIERVTRLPFPRLT